MRAVSMAVIIAAVLFFLTSKFYGLNLSSSFSVNLIEWVEFDAPSFADLKHLFQAAKLVIY